MISVAHFQIVPGWFLDSTPDKSLPLPRMQCARVKPYSENTLSLCGNSEASQRPDLGVHLKTGVEPSPTNVKPAQYTGSAWLPNCFRNCNFGMGLISEVSVGAMLFPCHLRRSDAGIDVS